MKKFIDIPQPEDKTKKVVRLIVPVELPIHVSPYEVMDEFMNLCVKKNWKCSGGGVQFPDNDPTI